MRPLFTLQRFGFVPAVLLPECLWDTLHLRRILAKNTPRSLLHRTFTNTHKCTSPIAAEQLETTAKMGDECWAFCHKRASTASSIMGCFTNDKAVLRRRPNHHGPNRRAVLDLSFAGLGGCLRRGTRRPPVAMCSCHPRVFRTGSPGKRLPGPIPIASSHP